MTAKQRTATKGRPKRAAKPATKKTAAAGPRPVALIYQLKIELLGVEPPVWRRVRVPGEIALGLLHAVIQVVMGWTNSHLHQFDIDGRHFVDPQCEPDEDASGPELLDEHAVRLMDVMREVKGAFVYEYDFGDGWQHQVTVEKIEQASGKREPFAECSGGGRACPPDDCGGPPGYEHFVRAVSDPDHDEHEFMLEWYGARFDPEEFDLEDTNAYLGKLKWPRMTIGQLGRVLRSRDLAARRAR